MFILSSVLFGLIHWNNFNGDLLQMIPYMFVGAGFAVIYYKSQNIWQNIMTHFFFDFIQVLAAGVMLIVSLLQ
ncbi:CPBP family intramembrane glutamic endopeptidase [Pediococcus acidilactici]|nr:CPBP family intramembrane glutamic endopeptidase [Pediococcus acidilactici]